MFSNLSWYEVVALLLLALFIFGDKLPKVITDGMRLLRNMRRMAQSATTDLGRELGTDIQLEDLHPKTFVRKHLLSEEDQEKLLRPLKGVSDELREQGRGVEQDLRDASRQADEAVGAARGRRNSRSLRATKDGATRAPDPAPAAEPPPAADSVPSPRPGLDDVT